jgi:hypothetical protein
MQCSFLIQKVDKKYNKTVHGLAVLLGQYVIYSLTLQKNHTCGQGLCHKTFLQT